MRHLYWKYRMIWRTKGSENGPVTEQQTPTWPPLLKWSRNIAAKQKQNFTTLSLRWQSGGWLSWLSFSKLQFSPSKQTAGDRRTHSPSQDCSNRAVIRPKASGKNPNLLDITVQSLKGPLNTTRGKREYPQTYTRRLISAHFGCLIVTHGDDLSSYWASFTIRWKVSG